MKLEQILILQLYNTKQITLQGIGTFRLDPSFSVTSHSDKKILFPNGAITFEYEPKVTEDVLLIDSIVRYTKKIKPLATSDLDSFVMSGKELLALNNPFVLNGIGSIVKTSNGALQFIPDRFAANKVQQPKKATKGKLTQGSKDHTPITGKAYKKNLLIVIGVFAVSLVAWRLIHLINKKNSKTPPEQTQQAHATSLSKPRSLDSVKTSNLMNPLKERGATFKIVFLETADFDEATKKFNEITGFGHSPVLHKSDSFYKVAIVFRLPLSDTLRIKDSLDQYYSLGRGYVEVE